MTPITRYNLMNPTSKIRKILFKEKISLGAEKVGSKNFVTGYFGFALVNLHEFRSVILNLS